MKASLSTPELVSYTQWVFEQIQGAQLQGLSSSETLLCFDFYKYREFKLVFDLQPSAPKMILLTERWSIKGAQPKPVAVFLNSHAKNLRLHSMKVDEQQGRVVLMELSGGDKVCFLTAVLIPRTPNFFAETEGKKISWNKPRELATSQSQPSAGKPRDWSVYEQEWLSVQLAGKKDKTLTVDNRLEKMTRDLSKKRKALEGVAQQLEQQSDHVVAMWQQLGEHLKYQSQPPPELASYFNPKLSVAQNREEAFHQAKEIKRKRQGTMERQELIRKEILDLEAKMARFESQASEAVSETTQDEFPKKRTVVDEGIPKPSLATAVLRKAEARGKTYRFSDNVEAVIGKSGVDNLKILRQARAWDLWVHLRDYPGAYAIVFHEKNRPVPQATLIEISQQLIAASVKNHQGVKFDIVMAECRYVKPVKGAKAGLVTYNNERVFTVASPAREIFQRVLRHDLPFIDDDDALTSGLHFW